MTYVAIVRRLLLTAFDNVACQIGKVFYRDVVSFMVACIEICHYRGDHFRLIAFVIAVRFIIASVEKSHSTAQKYF